MVFTWCPELLYSTTLRNVPCDILAISLTASHLFFFLSINKNRILMKTLSNKCIKFSDTTHHVTLQISHVGYTREWSISEDQRKKASPFLYKITDVHTSRWKYQGCVLIYRIAVQCRHLTFTLWRQKHKCIYTHLKKKNITSGARYSGVPQKVFMVAASVMPSLQSPKSVILIWPSLSSIKFSNWKEIKISLSLCDTLLTGWTLFVHCGVKLVITLKRKAVRDE